MNIWKSLTPKMLWEKLSKPESNLSLKYSIAFGDVMLFMILLLHTCYLMWFLFYSKLLALTFSLLFVILNSLLKSSFLSCISLQAFSVQSFLGQGRWSVRAFPYNRERSLTRQKGILPWCDPHPRCHKGIAYKRVNKQYLFFLRW